MSGAYRPGNVATVATVAHMDHRPDRARSFGAAAESYDRYRPSYPPEALRWALGPALRTVVDLGAGTGIMTRLLADLGHRVIAVEPDDAMRARLSAVSGDVTCLAGSAEAIPLDDASVDAVVAAQAYHWFDHERTHAEIARVVRVDGVFAPVWNIRNTDVEWVAELKRLNDGLDGDDDTHAGWRLDGGFGPLFTPVQRRVFDHAMRTAADDVVAMIHTRSSYLTAAPEQRTRFDDDLRHLLTDLPATFDVPYNTVTYRARRVARH